MKLEHKKAISAAVWVSSVCSAGLLAQLTSRSAWVIAAAIAILPPLVAMRYWNTPDQSMSESIQDALR
jgi:hypothetical protein